MNNYDMSGLEKFEKPDKDFIKDKECLICLESIDLESNPIDLESNPIVKLPCKCANSVYHIICIIKLLHSGENKNFCPHCKTIYEISFARVHVPHRQVVPLQNIFRENLETPENIEQIITCLSYKAREISQIQYHAIEIGNKADLTIFDPEIEWELTINNLISEYPFNPFFEKKIKGKILGVINGGKASIQN